ncbi:hypothetical protein JOF28_002786 [Leucobacter exalbidus]|uniref:Excalibur calcium-binding domain-containing protein n=1 Tax=Leucobacter exalbidus TaxID=662960 RepID=A0A940T574_9MICO|nr:hypothetical protein [Leucobacter exalbidus]
MNRPSWAGRGTRASAALLAALVLFTTGCTEILDEAGTGSTEPSASFIEELYAGVDTASDASSDASSDGASAEAGADASTEASAGSDGPSAGSPLDLNATNSGAQSDGDSGSGSSPDAAPASAGSALALLAELPVKGRAPKTGYDRKAQFGSPWSDVDRNGCDTRNDILQRDLTDLTMQGRCKVLAGHLADKYTGQSIDFVRGDKTSSLVQIDHIVALSDAWQKGAQKLTQEQRVSLANDPINLFAAEGRANSSKGDSDTASWLPSNRGFRCEYVAHQVSVKAAYALWVTPAEHDAMQRVLTTCPDQPAVLSELSTVVPDHAGDAGGSGAGGSAAGAGAEPSSEAPAASTVPAPVVTPAPVPEPVPAPEPAPAPAPAPAPSVHYQNCTAARDAGAAPVHAGDAGYGRHLDRDGDGIGCE